jgi:NAD(P)-dependent dehydrogenase (short-subunit alcohol dehydrogenase family)
MGNVLITGANKGIGFELAKQLQARGETIHATCRNSSPDLDGLGAQVYTGIDIRDHGTHEKLFQQLQDVSLDLVIQNAGILTPTRLGELDPIAIREQFEVNALGPLMLTEKLLSKIPSGGKIALISSRMGSIADNTSGSSYGYRMSKVALNIAGVSLAQDIRDRQIAVTILHPGYVQTDITGGRGFITADVAAKGLIERIDDLSLDTSGRFWHQSGEELPW